MNCCVIIILLLLCGKGNTFCENNCGNNCIQPRRHSANTRGMNCDNHCGDSVSNCTKTQTVITRTECDMDSGACNVNMATDHYGQSRYSMYGMKDDDCGCGN